ncbi:formylglycine-generating enzyme family protein [Chloroflexus sp.]
MGASRNLPAGPAGWQQCAGRREYPWGDWDEPHPGIRANTKESKIGGTSVVGIFPRGAAACGAEELAGNVWEWCSTPYLNYPFQGEVDAESLYTGNKRAGRYVLRGGSWLNARTFARGAYRDGLNPDYVYDG